MATAAERKAFYAGKRLRRKVTTGKLSLDDAMRRMRLFSGALRRFASAGYRHWTLTEADKTERLRYGKRNPGRSGWIKAKAIRIRKVRGRVFVDVLGLKHKVPPSILGTKRRFS